MPNITRALRSDTFSINDQVAITGGTADPSVTDQGDITALPQGSIYVRTTGQLYQKTGTGNLNWSPVSLSGAASLNDTDVSHVLNLLAGSNLTADRSLTFTTGDASRVLTINGNATLDDWFNQSVKTTDTVQFAKIGIGTSSPLGALDVAGTLFLSSSGVNTIKMSSPAGGGGNYGAFEVYRNLATTPLRTVLFQGEGVSYVNGGAFGLGTTVPSATLHALNSGTPLTVISGTIANFQRSGTTDSALVSITASDTGSAALLLGKVSVQNSGSILYNNATKYMALHTNALERMRITSAGSIGVNTTNPRALLHAFRSGGVSTPSTDTVALFEKSATGEGAGISIMSSTSGVSSIYMGDPTSDSIQKIVASNASNYMAFTTNAAERMRIDSSGNVGIGTTSPGQKLTVAGIIESTSGGIKFPDATIQTTAAGIGNTSTDVNVTWYGDFSGDMFSRVTPLFPWSAPVKLANPASLPVSQVNGISWSPNGEFLVASNNATPFIVIYKRNGEVFTKLPDPASLPVGISTVAAWSGNSEFLAIGHATTPFITIYQRSGNTFTKLANPVTLPPGSVNKVTFSPSGEFLVVVHQITPFITIYQRSGTTFTKLANPASLPTGQGRAVSWSPTGKYLSVGHDITPFITTYKVTNATFTKLTNPATLPTDKVFHCSWDVTGEFLATGHNLSPFMTVYQRSVDTLTKIADPATLPPQLSTGVDWSPSGKFLAVLADSTPFLHIYSKSGTTLTKLADPASLPPGITRSVAFSPDQQFLAVGSTTTPFLEIYQTTGDMPSTGQMQIIGAKRAGT